MDEALQREIGTAAFVRRSHRHSALQDRLDSIERLLADERLEITSPGHTELGNLDEARVKPIQSSRAKLCGFERQAASRAQAKARDSGEDLFLGR